jgi:hypothetical protein
VSISVADFVAYFPEFKGDGSVTTNARLQSYINHAVLRTPSDVWGDLVDQGVLYLAAHLLAISPYGINAKLGNAAGNSVYGVERSRLNRTVSYARGSYAQDIGTYDLP